MSGRGIKDCLIVMMQPLARAIPGGMALGRAVHRLIDPEKRVIHRLRARSDIALYQPFPTTFDNRYAELFGALAERLKNRPEPRILSFGCSSGDEVRALRRHIPHARITGVDVNSHALAKARQADPAHGEDYIEADRPPPGARYDAILAMAVFRHGALEEHRPSDCSAILPFARVAEGIARLDSSLQNGGWLAMGNAHFRFCDMPVAAAYEPDPLRLPDLAPQTLLYGPDDRRLDVEPYKPILFRKL